MELMNFWRKSYRVQAVRLTQENMREIAEVIGGDYVERPNPVIPHITKNGNAGFVGDWYLYTKNIHLFFADDDFTSSFQTHAQTFSENEEYARIFQLVMSAMNATAKAVHDGGSTGMDLLAMQTTRQILKQL
jgi:hypothetical protein